MNNNKIGAMFIISAFVLAGIGGSYAMWSETIVMSGTVTAGSLDFKWSIVGTDDTEIPEKDLTSGITAVLSNNDNTMTVTVTGAYPCIYYYVYFDIDCIGTVPVHFNDFVIDAPTGWVSQDIITIGPDNVNHPGQLVITDLQLHQSEHWYGVLAFHFTNIQSEDIPIAQGTTYVFTVSLFGYQYNEECDGGLSPKIIEVPTDPVTAFYNYPHWGDVDLNLPSYWDIEIPGIDERIYPWAHTDFWYDGWCVDEFHTIYDHTTQNVQLWSTLEYNSPEFPWPGNGNAPDGMDWPCVNYILNHKGSACWSEIQDAIWYFVDGGILPPAGPGRDLVYDALDHVEDWYFNFPQTGDIVAILLYDPLLHQQCIIEVDP
jgi:hypothetical protein